MSRFHYKYHYQYLCSFSGLGSPFYFYFFVHSSDLNKEHMVTESHYLNVPLLYIISICTACPKHQW